MRLTAGTKDRIPEGSPNRTALGRSPAVFRRTALFPLALLLVGIFVMRIYYGLSLELRTGDDVQVYLLGLKFFTTGRWPFFGPDVCHETQTQLPGALQGLLVGVPLVLTRQPEAPLILLNILSFTGVLFLALYFARRFAVMSTWLTCVWLLTSPWTLYFGTHVYNPSYLLLPSCLFFVAFLELMPSWAANLLPPSAAFLLLGLSLGAALQLHLSWPLLVPFLVTAVVARARAGLLTPLQIGWLFLGQPARSRCSGPPWSRTALPRWSKRSGATRASMDPALRISS